MKIGYFGEEGAYSNIAAMNMKNGQYIPLDSVRTVFTELENGNINYGVVPVENSIEGSVNQTFDYLYKMPFYIIMEYYLRIKHCLIGFNDSNINEIKYVHSHPQALAQCSDFIYRHKFIPVNEYDTAGSVKIIKKFDKSHAAIASEIAAGINNMKIISRDMENNKRNYTRFILVSKTPEINTGKLKTSIVFSMPHRPGSLYKILEILNKYNINMTKIESRPVDFNLFNYIFFIDFENNENDRNAINEIREKAGYFREIGAYKISEIPYEEEI